MAVDSAHTNARQTSDFVFGVPLLAALALQLLLPFSLHRGLLRPILIAAGIALVAAGILLVTAARRELIKQGQPVNPGKATSGLVTTGIFAYSRNPLYLGATLLAAGIAIALNLPWELLFLVPSVVLCHYVLIVPEERYLGEKFGDAYTAYKARVPRWFGTRRERSEG